MKYSYDQGEHFFWAYGNQRFFKNLTVETNKYMVTGCRGRGNIYEILNSIRCHLVNFLLQYFTHLIQAENLTVDLRILREPSSQEMRILAMILIIAEYI